VRGDEYSRVRVDVAASELTLGAELARGGASVVFAGSFGGARVAIKRPKLRTRADMDRYHKELQLVRREAAQKHCRRTRCLRARTRRPLAPDAARAARWSTRTCLASWQLAPGRPSIT
jgi:hypothetical protein